MKILDTFSIKGRGTCAVLEIVDPEPALGSKMVRSDGATWTVRGIEKCVAYSGAPPNHQKIRALLLAGDEEFAPGDELERLVEKRHEESCPMADAARSGGNPYSMSCTCARSARCDECDPSYGCFDGSAQCSKKF